MANKYVSNVDDIARVFKVDEDDVAEAVKILKCEGIAEKYICVAANRNYNSLFHAPIKQFKESLLYVSRLYMRSLMKNYDDDKPSGNPVRDRILEVGVYNPYHPDYVDKTLKGRGGNRAIPLY